MKPGALILASGPLDPADWWSPLAADLSRADLPVTAPVDAAHAPPFSVAWIASISQRLTASAVDHPLVIVGHGSSGPLLPALARAQRATGRSIGGYVFVDATLPRTGPSSHLDLLRAAAPEEAELAHQRLHSPDGFWPEAGPDQGDFALRPRDHEFWTETLPPAIDWPDAPCAYVRTGHPAAGCGDTRFWARSARSRGWAVDDTPDTVAAIRRAVDQLPG